MTENLIGEYDLEERRTKAIELKRISQPWGRIAQELGYQNAAHAAADVLTALEKRRRETARQLDAYVQLELEKLDGLERLMYGIIRRKHILVQQGRVIIDPLTQEIVLDETPMMQASDRILKIMERRAKLLGLDSAVKLDMQVSDDTNTRIETLIAQMAKETHDPRRLEILAAPGTPGTPETPHRTDEQGGSENQR